mmetsp:Transcript_62819/g.168556  ORF Transcript_62819/g.168556 Transcript_62819/m.168556 type:complete len:228 (-) Transcript_62819:763-1446(-)
MSLFLAPACSIWCASCLPWRNLASQPPCALLKSPYSKACISQEYPNTSKDEMSSHFTPRYSSSALLYSPTSKVCSQPPKFLLPQIVTLQASHASSRLLHCSLVAGFSPLHFGPLQCTSRVRVPSPQCALHSPQSPTLYKQPLWFSQGRLCGGFLAPPQSSSWPEEQDTLRTWMPSPHSVEQEPHAPVSQWASNFFALPSPFFSHPSGMGTGTASFPFKQSGGFSQTM